MTCTEVDGVRRAARLLREARHAIALTGAGVSTPSGLPDFRTPGFGLWESVDPGEVASLRAFRRRPAAFYAWIRPLLSAYLTAQPNAGHLALAELGEAGWLKAIITQNIDGLHQRAGSREVLELHGHLREATCLDCYQVLPVPGLLDRFPASGEVMRCPACGGVLKPNVVLFGEQLPVQVYLASTAHVREADLMLVAGSSLEVFPASAMPAAVVERGGRLIIVNLSETHLDGAADVVLHADVADALPQIARACSGG